MKRLPHTCTFCRLCKCNVNRHSGSCIATSGIFFLFHSRKIITITCKPHIPNTYTHTHTPYLCGFGRSDTVTWCMVEWCTQNLRRNGSISRGTSHATPEERYQYTTSVDINNTRYKRIQSLNQSHMPICAVSPLESRK